jgi:hypothetical protein
MLNIDVIITILLPSSYENHTPNWIKFLLGPICNISSGPPNSRGQPCLSCNEIDTFTLQVRDNPSGDFKSMHRHISKGAWTFSDQDHGWQLSDCTSDGLKVTNNIG